MSERELEEASVMKPEEVDIGLNTERKKYKLFKDKGDLELDANVEEVDLYAQHKNYAKGLMDLALLTANANQLSRHYSKYGFSFVIVFLILSLVLQVTAGVLLLLDHRIRIKTRKDLKQGTRFTDAITIIIFFVIVLNILFASFEGAERTKSD
jgi:hypothetical protein